MLGWSFTIVEQLQQTSIDEELPNLSVIINPRYSPGQES